MGWAYRLHWGIGWDARPIEGKGWGDFGRMGCGWVFARVWFLPMVILHSLCAAMWAILRRVAERVASNPTGSLATREADAAGGRRNHGRPIYDRTAGSPRRQATGEPSALGARVMVPPAAVIGWQESAAAHVAASGHG